MIGESAPARFPWSEMDLLKRHTSIFEAEKSALLVVDMQTRLLEAIPNADALVASVRRLVAAAGVLGVDVIYTEQNPSRLGPTVDALAALLKTAPRFEKMSFTALGAERIGESLSRPQVAVVGVETHVCISQTALDLVASERTVAVCADAVAARRDFEHATALRRLALEGVVVTSVEALLFEWAKEAGTEAFREVLALIKESSRMPASTDQGRGL